MPYIVKNEKSACYGPSLPWAHPVEMADTTEGVAPAGFAIMSACFVVDKMDVAICDGKDKWYITAGDGTVKYIAAGRSWAELYA